MTVNASNLGAVVVALTAQGDTQIIGEMISYCDAPTVGLCGLINSSLVDWRADMCRPASPQEEIEYWKQRALRRDHPTEMDLVGVPPPFSISEQCARICEMLTPCEERYDVQRAAGNKARACAAAIRERFKS
jgi:hypothetical protein